LQKEEEEGETKDHNRSNALPRPGFSAPKKNDAANFAVKKVGPQLLGEGCRACVFAWFRVVGGIIVGIYFRGFCCVCFRGFGLRVCTAAQHTFPP
jgi:hypothetical protein